MQGVTRTDPVYGFQNGNDYRVTQPAKNTGHSPAAEIKPMDKHISWSDFGRLFFASKQAASRWYFIGTQLDVGAAELNEISADHASEGVEKIYMMLIKLAIEQNKIRTPKDLHSAMSGANLRWYASQFKEEMSKPVPAFKPRTNNDAGFLKHAIRFNTLKGVNSKWYYLGILLKVDLYKLEEINADKTRGRTEKCVQMLRSCIDGRGSEITVDELIDALKKMERPLVAGAVEQALSGIVLSADGEFPKLTTRPAPKGREDDRCLAEVRGTESERIDELEEMNSKLSEKVKKMESELSAMKDLELKQRESEKEIDTLKTQMGTLTSLLNFVCNQPFLDKLDGDLRNRVTGLIEDGSRAS